MQYVGFLWPRDEQHVLASGDVLFHATARKNSAAATRDARRLHALLGETDDGVLAYVAGVKDSRIIELHSLEIGATDDGPVWVDGQYVRHRIPSKAAQSYRLKGGVVTLDPDGKLATVDFPVRDAKLAGELVAALRTQNPNEGLRDEVVALLDQIRGTKSRYEAAQELRSELAKVRPPKAVLAEKEAKKEAAAKARERSESLAKELAAAGGLNEGEARIAKLKRKQSDGALSVNELAELRALRSAVSKIDAAQELVGEVDCDPPAPAKAIKWKWFDGSTADVLVGNKTTLYVPSPTGAPTAIRATYALIPENKLGVSHDPWTFTPTPGYDQTLQERDYAVAQQEQAKVIFGTQWFEPRFTLNSTPSAVDGPPIIDPAGHALGGNGRGMMIRRSIRENDRYVDDLRRQLTLHSKVFGLSPQQAKGNVLVRVVDETDIDRKDISARLNASFTQSIDDHAGAVSIGQRLPVELLSVLAERLDEGSLSEAITKTSPTLVKHLQQAKIITPYNVSDWLVHKGGRVIDELSTRGKERLRAALLGAAVNDKTLLAHMEAFGLRDIVERISPVLLAIEQIEDEELRKRYSMLAPIRKSLVPLSEVVSLSDGEFVDHFSNFSLFDEGPSATDDILSDAEAISWMLWLRARARGSRTEGQRVSLNAWRALPATVRKGGGADMFASASEELSREEWFAAWELDSPALIEAVGARDYIAGDRTPKGPPPTPPKKETPAKVEPKKVVARVEPAQPAASQPAEVVAQSKRREAVVSTRGRDAEIRFTEPPSTVTKYHLRAEGFLETGDNTYSGPARSLSIETIKKSFDSEAAVDPEGIDRATLDFVSAGLGEEPTPAPSAPKKKTAPETVKPKPIKRVSKDYAWGSLYMPPRGKEIRFTFTNPSVAAASEQTLLDAGYERLSVRKYRMMDLTPETIDAAVRLADSLGGELNEYEARQEAKRARLLERADAKRQEAARAHESSHELSGAFYMGQPILIGHHSEKRARRLQEKMHTLGFKGADLYKYADELEYRASRVGTGGISSDDPDAIPKLKAELVEAELLQDQMKAVNAIVRKTKNVEKRVELLQELGMTEEEIIDALRPKLGRGGGYIPAQLSSNNARIKRISGRIKQLESKARLVEIEKAHSWGVYRESPDENRVMFEFPDKPSDDARRLLRSNAFKWSPTRGAWVRQLTANAMIYGRQVAAQLDEMQKE